MDGHHRLNILKSLGYSKIAAHVVNYLNNEEIKVRTWYPLITYLLADPFDLFGNYFLDTKNGQLSEIGTKLHLKEGSFILNLSREKVMNLIKGKGVAALSFNPISKKEVISSALSGKKFSLKTTRHIIPKRPRNWHVPFERLE